MTGKVLFYNLVLMLAYLIHYFSVDVFSYVGISVALFLTGIGMPIPEDIILLAAGYVTAKGFAELPVMMPLTCVMILVGDLVTYWLGYKFGASIVSIRPFSYVFTEARMVKTRELYTKYGKSIIFLGRFFAGFRAWIYLFAGISKMSVWRFIFMDFLATLISVPLLVWLGFYFNSEIDEAAMLITRIKEWLVIVIGIIVILVITYRASTRAKTPAASGPAN